MQFCNAVLYLYIHFRWVCKELRLLLPDFLPISCSWQLPVKMVNYRDAFVITQESSAYTFVVYINSPAQPVF
jgi:hypothetical protein